MADVNTGKRASKIKRKFSFKEKLVDQKHRKRLKRELTDMTINEDEEIEEKSETETPATSKQTVSVALPGSILENAQSPELRTYLAGQIARALVIFNVDEVVVFNECHSKRHNEGLFKGSTKSSDPNVLLARILQYLECPQYLRKEFFPVHQDLKYAGVLNPLDCPHHMRVDDVVSFREGVTLNRPVKKGDGSFVNVGMRKEVKIDKHLKSNIRVTVKMDAHDLDSIEKKSFLSGKVVAPTAPLEHGLYWGYTVRVAHTFSAVFTQSPFKGGYDLTIGTSERGMPVHQLNLPPFKHLLLVFGGLKGLETSIESDETLKDNEAELLFDYYVNTCPNQGSRTIRTEEALLVSLTALQPQIAKLT